tara:strand:+ start:2157 stop:2735 length:579 start_codon:yes stop_codon:yes gene_type:complete
VIRKLLLFLFFLNFLKINAQKIDNYSDIKIEKQVIENIKTDPLRPAKSAFYSAVLPGLGQAYNRKYWKIPIVYGAIGTALYFYFDNDKIYDRYRYAYKRRLAGFTDDEFYGPNEVPFISQDALIRAQRALKRNKEVSMLITVGMYVLNIIDANVDAHLLQYNIDDNLSFQPFIDFNNPDYDYNLGLEINLNF